MPDRGSARFLGAACVVSGLALAACVPSPPTANVVTRKTRAVLTPTAGTQLSAATTASPDASTDSAVDPTPVLEHPKGALAAATSSVGAGGARAQATAPTNGFAGKADPGTGPDVWAVVV